MNSGDSVYKVEKVAKSISAAALPRTPVGERLLSAAWLSLQLVGRGSLKSPVLQGETT